LKWTLRFTAGGMAAFGLLKWAAPEANLLNFGATNAAALMPLVLSLMSLTFTGDLEKPGFKKSMQVLIPCLLTTLFVLALSHYYSELLERGARMEMSKAMRYTGTWDGFFFMYWETPWVLDGMYLSAPALFGCALVSAVLDIPEMPSNGIWGWMFVQTVVVFGYWMLVAYAVRGCWPLGRVVYSVFRFFGLLIAIPMLLLFFPGWLTGGHHGAPGYLGVILAAATLVYSLTGKNSRAILSD